MAKKVIRFELDGFAEDAFDVISFSGTEGVSTYWSYTVSVVSKLQVNDFDKMLEAKAHLHFGEPELHIHGMLCSAQQGFDSSWQADTAQRTRVDFIMVPDLWKLTLNVVTKFFRDMTLKDIITKVLQKHGITAEFKLDGKHPKHASVLQFQESDLNFLQRMCEHEGAHYHLVHGESEEKVVFADVNEGFKKVQAPFDLPLRLPKNALKKSDLWGPWGDEKTVRRFQRRQRFVPKTVILQDYNYMTPGHNLEVKTDAPGKASSGTQFFFGENYKDTNQGEALRDLRKEEILARKMTYTGVSNAYHLYAGGLFAIIEADLVAAGLAGEYVVTEFQCTGSQLLERTKVDEGGYGYDCTFTCLPKAVVYRPPLRTRWPEMQGLYHAQVLTSGEQYSDVDKEGRYHVQFKFDLDKAGSIPVRRLESYVGESYGFHAPLHRGVEVLVAFENGDPDRPIIVAATHNPAFPDTVLADNHTQSVWRSGGNNEFMMDDTKGSEKFYQHCEKDLEIKTKNDKSEYTGNDEKLEVKNNRERKVGVDEKVEIGSNREKTVGADETIKIGGNQTIEVAANLKHTTEGSKTTAVTGDFDETIDGNETRKVSGTTDWTHTGDHSVKMEANSTIDVGSDSDLTVGGNKTEEVGGNSEAEASGNITFEAGGKIESEASDDITFESGGSIEAEATKEISFDANIKIAGESHGNIEFEAGLEVKIEAGTNLKMEGKSGVEIKGAKYEVNAQADAVIKGAIIKLN